MFLGKDEEVHCFSELLMLYKELGARVQGLWVNTEGEQS